MASTLVPLKSFVGMTSAELSTVRAQWLACLSAIALVGAEYEIGGRKFKRPDTPYVTSVLTAITYAQNKLAGTAVTRTLANFNVAKA